MGLNRSKKNREKWRFVGKDLRHFPSQHMPESKYGVNIISCAVSPFKALLENNDERTVSYEQYFRGICLLKHIAGGTVF